MIPYEYNYYLALSFYSKLSIYQERVRLLHTPSSFSIFTFSNIISRKVLSGLNGLEITKGFIIFRTLDDRLLEHLKLGLAFDPDIRITETIFRVKSLKETEQVQLKDDLGFRTLSPVLVRDFRNKEKYVTDPKEIEENINMTTQWFMKNKIGIQEPNIKIEILTSHRKTCRISSNAGKNSITTCFNLTGTIKGNPSEIQLLYYRGLGSKTGLGLGCWEVN